MQLPFSAHLGNDKAKKAIILNLINPRIGGVLLRAESGTGKSALLRGLQLGVVCPNQIGYENLVGSVDLAAALKGERLHHRGALLKAVDGRAIILDQLHLFNRSVLSTIIKTQQSGQFSVERSGFSKQIKTNFAILAALNPSESTLPTSVIDDFGIIVDLAPVVDLAARCQIIDLAMKNSRQLAPYFQKDKALRNAIKHAQLRLKSVILPFALQLEMAKLIADYQFSGNHLDIKLMETALAIAALAEHQMVTAADLKEAAELVLYARHQSSAAPQTSDDQQPQDNDNTQSNAENAPQEQTKQQEQTPNEQQDDLSRQSDLETQSNVQSNDRLTTEQIGRGIDYKIGSERERTRDQIIGTGKREKRIGKDRHGHTVFYRTTDKYDDIDIFGTIMKAAPYQIARHKAINSKLQTTNQPRLIIKKSDLQRKVREHRIGNTLIFLLDASGSLRANQRMAALKGTIFNLLSEAYVKRDKVALIAFRDDSVDLALPVTGSMDLANRRLKELPSGGNSPIAEALIYAKRYIESNQIKSRESKYVLIFLSDGRANASSFSDAPVDDAKKVAKTLATTKIKKVFIDYESGKIRLGLMKQLAELATAEFVYVDGLSEENLMETVQAVK